MDTQQAGSQKESVKRDKGDLESELIEKQNQII